MLNFSSRTKRISEGVRQFFQRHSDPNITFTKCEKYVEDVLICKGYDTSDITRWCYYATSYHGNITFEKFKLFVDIARRLIDIDMLAKNICKDTDSLTEIKKRLEKLDSDYRSIYNEILKINCNWCHDFINLITTPKETLLFSMFN